MGIAAHETEIRIFLNDVKKDLEKTIGQKSDAAHTSGESQPKTQELKGDLKEKTTQNSIEKAESLATVGLKQRGLTWGILWILVRFLVAQPWEFGERQLLGQYFCSNVNTLHAVIYGKALFSFSEFGKSKSDWRIACTVLKIHSRKFLALFWTKTGHQIETGRSQLF